jgi:putative exosortase-associated protein (TIGR04073 family)
MKKFFFVVLVFLYVISLSAFAGAEENGAWPPLEKLGRGVSNIVTFPLEIGKNVGRTNDKNGTFAALTTGVLQGLGDALIRSVVGVYEVVTFALPIPPDYKPVLTDPEYFLENGR